MEQQKVSPGFQQQLAVLSLILKGEHDAAAEYLRHATVTKHGFMRFIERHNLQPLLFSLLDGSPVRKCLPHESVDELKRVSLGQWAKQERLVHELSRLSNCFAAAGHEFILLKGPYLATRFFCGLGRRPFSDLDLLIRKEHLSAVEHLLRENGYCRKSNVLISRALTTYFTHAVDFVKPNVALDLHWALSANAAHHLDYDAIWRERQRYRLSNQSVSVLSDEYEIVFSLISIFKDLERGAARLKAFVDLYFILSALGSRLDWAGFIEHRRRERILQISVNVLALFLDVFDCNDRFPEVARAVSRELKLVKRVSSEEFSGLVEASPGALSNKLWAAGIYECSRAHVFLWWLTSLPFRLAVYDHRKHARFKHALQQRMNRWRIKLSN